ncbi:hypothetical protein F7Q99_27145 [Streptomyces kaniharaensis]|uniref:Uncharacterized protein n=1 Tax=Streptomyces kaniharaensis TaxID=212423 RepID=A0A6N7L105_9ACTN|nr:hypothetical protein [Streptomyces kaniharaensis]MQS15844.1 hypothetical protein [Streptomyces kaniharaensis]
MDGLPFRARSTADEARALPTPGRYWSAVIVNGGGGIHHAIRDASGNWSSFPDIAGQTGDIGAVGSISDAGVNGDTHVVAVGGDGHIYQTAPAAATVVTGMTDCLSPAGGWRPDSALVGA